jgi:hypothetical protein
VPFFFGLGWVVTNQAALRCPKLGWASFLWLPPGLIILTKKPGYMLPEIYCRMSIQDYPFDGID